MRVSDQGRVLFVHVPKTGGSTIDHIFDTEVPDARKVLQCGRHATYRKLIREEPGLADLWACGFVRNPWSRMVSWWSMGNDVYARAEAGRPKAISNIRDRPDVWGDFEAYRGDFRRFVLEGTTEVKRFGNPQVKWLTRKNGDLIDFVGKVESFVADVNSVRVRLGLEEVPEQPRRNPSSHGHYSDYYDDETRQRVADVFADDIAAFDYSYEERKPAEHQA